MKLLDVVALMKLYKKNEQDLQKDFLNSLTPNGLPLCELLLEPKCTIMLLRNIDHWEGLFNGTKLIYRECKPNVIDA